MNVAIAKDIFNCLMIAGIVLGIFFIAISYLSKRINHKSMKYLILVVLFLTLHNIQILLIDNNIINLNYFVRKLMIPWYLFIFPSFYAFLLHYLKIDKKLQTYFTITIALFVTQLIARVILVPFYYHETNNYTISRYAQVEEITNAVFCIFLFIKAFIVLFRLSNLYQYVLSYDNIKWLKVFMALGSGIILMWVTGLVFNFNKVMNPVLYIYYPMRLSCSFLLYWIGYQGFFNHRIMMQRIQLRKDIVAENQSNLTILKEKKIVETNIKTDDFIILKNHIENNNRYLDAEFTMAMLASECKMSTTKVSTIINNHSGFNFSDYINQLRVEKSKTILIEPKYQDYNIEAIGFECGFNSKSTFYLAFKKFTTLTPTEFKKQNA
jgi:AraC-like DNA-binding protein